MMAKMRYVRKSRQEALTAYSGITKTVYFNVLQEFNGDKWVDVPTIDITDIITGSETKLEKE